MVFGKDFKVVHSKLLSLYVFLCTPVSNREHLYQVFNHFIVRFQFLIAFANNISLSLQQSLALRSKIDATCYLSKKFLRMIVRKSPESLFFESVIEVLLFKQQPSKLSLILLRLICIIPIFDNKCDQCLQELLSRVSSLLFNLSFSRLSLFIARAQDPSYHCCNRILHLNYMFDALSFFVMLF